MKRARNFQNCLERENADPLNQKGKKDGNADKTFSQHEILASVFTSKIDVYKKRGPQSW